MITVSTLVQKLQNYKYLDSDDINSPCCSKAVENGTWWINQSGLTKARLKIFTVFKSLEFTWPQQRVHRRGQTQMDPACFCTDRQPDRQPTEELKDYGV